MDRSQKMFGRTVLGLVALLAMGAGALVAWWHSDGVSYTEPASNPSLSGESFVLTPAERRRPVTAFDFVDAEGRPLRFDHLRGKVVLINFWATWCPPCVAEMPALDTLQGRLGGPDFQVVAISLDRGGKAVAERWFGRNKIAHLGLYNGDPNRFEGGVLPTSWLLDSQGRVAWEGIGQQEWAGPEAERTIRALMAENATKG